MDCLLVICRISFCYFSLYLNYITFCLLKRVSGIKVTFFGRKGMGSDGKKPIRMSDELLIVRAWWPQAGKGLFC